MTKKKHNPSTHRSSVPHVTQPKSRKHTVIKVIVLTSMFLLLFSTIGATVIYLGNNPAVQPTQLQQYVTGAFLSGEKQQPKDDVIIPGLGALSGSNAAATGSSSTGAVSTGSNTSGTVLSGN